MGWVLGTIKSFMSSVSQGGYLPLVKKIIATFPPEKIHEIITNHDFESAEIISSDIYRELETYHPDTGALVNQLSSEGYVSTNPYFFEQALQVFIEGRKEGLLWDDDLVFNWGLYDDYEPHHHSYWGVHSAMVGECDDNIFPMNKLLPKMWDDNAIVARPIFRHPINGGRKQYIMSEAAGWLR
jgi:hypothetical protein